jgi:hypothetical protein
MWRPAGSRDADVDRAQPLANPAPVLAVEEPVPFDQNRGPDVEAPGGELAAPADEHLPAQLALAGESDPGPPASAAPPEEAADPPLRADAKLVLARAAKKLESLEAYQVKMQRRERVGGTVGPEEEILLSIRRKPKAVRLEWTGGSSKGREVIFSPALDSKMIFVHQPAASVLVPSMKIPVDSPLVMKNSRHSIAEAGFETILANLRKSKDDSEDGKAGGVSLQYKGLESAAGIDKPSHHFVRETASGEIWNVYLDPRSLLPRLVVAEDKQGDLLERYVYSDLRENPTELASAAAFSPTDRWGEGKGLLSRIAKAASRSNVPSSDAATTR